MDDVLNKEVNVKDFLKCINKHNFGVDFIKKIKGYRNNMILKHFLELIKIDSNEFDFSYEKPKSFKLVKSPKLLMKFEIVKYILLENYYLLVDEDIEMELIPNFIFCKTSEAVQYCVDNIELFVKKPKTVFLQYQSIIFDPKQPEHYKSNHFPKPGEICYFLGEIPNAQGHCIVVDSSNRVYTMIHMEHFRHPQNNGEV